MEETRTWRNEKHDAEEEGPRCHVRDPPQIPSTPSKPMPLPAPSFLSPILIRAKDPRPARGTDYAGSAVPPPPPPSFPFSILLPPVLSSARPPTCTRGLTGGESRLQLDSVAKTTIEQGLENQRHRFQNYYLFPTRAGNVGGRGIINKFIN